MSPDNHQALIADIIVPVYNAPGETASCLESIFKNSSENCWVTIINDNSDVYTKELLDSLCAGKSNVSLIHAEENRGFVCSVNEALKLSTAERKADFRVILNSDTIVPPGWIEAFQECFASDDLIGIACPLSNNAVNLSVDIPAGDNVFRATECISKEKVDHYPDITTAVGFCMAVTSEVLEKISGFDEVFSPGYGEESDFHFKALCEGFRSVLVPNCLVYHQSEASFSESKAALVKRNRKIFDQRWMLIYNNESIDHERRAPVSDVQERVKSSKGDKPHDVIFVLPTQKLFGGVIVVYDIVNRLCKRGIDANVVILQKENPIDMDLFFSPYFIPPWDWDKQLPKSKLYIATHYETCQFALKLHSEYKKSKIAYLVQGYEAWFPDASVQRVVETYRAIPNRICVSHWLQTMLDRWGCDSEVIPNGVDTNLFYSKEGFNVPAALRGKAKLLIFFRDDPQSGWKIGARLAKRLKDENVPVDIYGVGDMVGAPEVMKHCKRTFRHLDRKAMRGLMQEIDIFADCSTVQGFGLMGLEAMACGNAVITTNTGGVREYASQDNALLCSVGDEEELFSSVSRLARDHSLRAKLGNAGRETAEKFCWDSVINKYEDFITNCISSGAEMGAENWQALSRFYFERIHLPQAAQPGVISKTLPGFEQELQNPLEGLRGSPLLAKVVEATQQAAKQESVKQEKL